MIFLGKSFVVRRSQIAEGYARASLLVSLKNLLCNHFSSQLNCNGKTGSPISIDALGEAIDACLGNGSERSIPEPRAGLLEEPGCVAVL